MAELQLQLLLLPVCNGNIAVVVAVAVISISVVAAGAEYVAGVAYLAGPVPKTFSLALPRRNQLAALPTPSCTPFHPDNWLIFMA